MPASARCWTSSISPSSLCTGLDGRVYSLGYNVAQVHHAAQAIRTFRSKCWNGTATAVHYRPNAAAIVSDDHDTLIPEDIHAGLGRRVQCLSAHHAFRV